MSMKPGATTRPRASMNFAEGAPASSPRGAMRAIRSPRMATSPQNQGLPLPSTMRPLAITRS